MNKVITTPEIEATIAKEIAFIKRMSPRLYRNYSIGGDLAITRAEKRLEKLNVHFPVALPY